MRFPTFGHEFQPLPSVLRSAKLPPRRKISCLRRWYTGKVTGIPVPAGTGTGTATRVRVGYG